MCTSASAMLSDLQFWGLGSALLPLGTPGLMFISLQGQLVPWSPLQPPPPLFSPVLPPLCAAALCPVAVEFGLGAGGCGVSGCSAEAHVAGRVLGRAECLP